MLSYITATKSGLGVRTVVNIKVADIKPFGKGRGMENESFDPKSPEYAESLVAWLEQNGWKVSA